MSNEWLTTGQMIDRLKVGEVAQKQNADTCIKRVTSVLYKYCLANGDTSGFREVTLDSMIVGHKWRIIPNYVSFEQAMKAVRAGKAVYLHTIQGEKVCRLKKESFLTFGNWQLEEFINGKWTIEDDTNA